MRKLLFSATLALLFAFSAVAETDYLALDRIDKLVQGVEIGTLYKAADLESTDDVTVGDDLVVTDDASVGGDLTLSGALTGGLTYQTTTATNVDLTTVTPTQAGTLLFGANAAGVGTNGVYFNGTTDTNSWLTLSP